jgi:amino acid synthesis protein
MEHGGLRSPDDRTADARRGRRRQGSHFVECQSRGGGAVLDVPLGHKDDSWSFEHFDTITVSLADAPRPAEILVVMAIADGGPLDNRCGSTPIR